MGILARLVEQIEELLQRIGIVAHMADDGVQALQNLIGILCQQTLGVLVEDLQSILVLSRLH